MANAKKIEIGIYKTYSNEYFALGISGYKMRKIKDNDKHTLAIKIRNKLNEKGINECFIRPVKNGEENYCSLTGEELETIARSMSYNSNAKDLNIKINEKIYFKK